jgi:hypothetical protein
MTKSIVSGIALKQPDKFMPMVHHRFPALVSTVSGHRSDQSADSAPMVQHRFPTLVSTVRKAIGSAPQPGTPVAKSQRPNRATAKRKKNRAVGVAAHPAEYESTDVELAGETWQVLVPKTAVVPDPEPAKAEPEPVKALAPAKSSTEIRNTHYASILPSDEWQNETIARLREAEAELCDSPDSPAARTAVTQLEEQIYAHFRQYLDLAAKATWKQFRHFRGKHGLEELETTAKISFFRALRGFRLGGPALSHLVSRWLKHELLRTAVAESKNTLVNPCARFASEARELDQMYIRKGTAAAEALITKKRWTDDKVIRLGEYQKQTGSNPSDKSLDALANASGQNAGSGRTAHELVADSEAAPAAGRSFVADEVQNELAFVVERTLDPREAFVLQATYGTQLILDRKGELGRLRNSDGTRLDTAEFLRTIAASEPAKKTEKIAAFLGISRESVRQLHVRAIAKMQRQRDFLRSRGIDQAAITA